MSETPTRTPFWLDATFAGSAVALVILLGVAMAREWARPPLTAQRIVPALGVVDRCEHCHSEDTHPGETLTHHPPERFGCTPCHGGQGWALTARDAHEARPDWERPLFTPAEREAACGRCHLSGPVPGAPRLEVGRRLLDTLGCRACHALPGAGETPPGLPLDGLSLKVEPAWVRWFLTAPANPDGPAPRHRMPRFDLEPDAVEDLVAYLLRPAAPLAAAPEGDAERGRTAVATRRCATCHRIEGRGGDFAPSLDLAGAKMRPEWLVAFLRAPHAIRPGIDMPEFGLDEREAADIAAYIAEQLVSDTGETPWSKAIAVDGDPARRAEAGRAVFARSGCRGCHVTADVPLDRPGAPLAQIAGRTAAERPPAADGEDPPDVPAFVARKVASPRVFDPPGGPAGVMPQFRTTPDEAVAIGIAVAALGGRSVPVEYRRDAAPRPFAPPPGVIADLFERKRCLSCHRIGGTGGDLSRIPLDGVGARLERAWLARFLEAPTTVRLDQPERMPVLGLSTDDAARLADYLSLTLDAAWSAEPVPTGDAARGEALYNRQGCATCHVHRGRGALGGPGLDDAPRRLRPVYLSSLLRAPERVPNGRHAAVRLSAGEAADVAAFLSTAAAPATVVPAAE